MQLRASWASKMHTEAYYEGEYDAAYLVRAGDYLVGMDGDFNLRRWAGPDSALNQRVMRINGWRCDIDPEFVKPPLQMVLDYLHGDTSLTTVKHLSAKQVNGIEIPLPPLAERRRIVAKVEELMALLDRLEAARQQREANRDRLTAASLARLTAPDTEASSGKVGTGFPSDDATNKNSAEFPAKARFALATLPALTTRPDQIKPLRQTILNLAVRGKLVAQDPTDEPASELLKRIAAEKARMVKAGEIKVRKLQARGRSEPLDLSLPKGWVLTELGAVALKITDGAHKTPTFVDRGVPFVSVKDFSGGKLDLSNTRFIPEAEHQVLYQRFDPQRGDILLGRIGTLGKAVLVDADVEFSLFVSVGLIRFDHQNLLPEFFRLLLNSPFVEEEFDRIKIGGGTHTNKLNLASINMTQLRGCPIPLPALAEQHRIVARVDALMALCDRLEAALTTTDTTRARLLEALLHQALDPAGITGAGAAGSAGAGPNVDALHQKLPNPRQQPPLPRVNRAI
jgi:type I restriction enzyme S subunit